MPKLLAYIPCENVLIDEFTKNASITAVISEIGIKIPQGFPVPSKGTFIIAMQWNIFSLWEWEEIDSNLEFETKSQLVAQSGEVLFETNITESKKEPHKNFQRNIDRITGFPIWVSGRVELRLMFRVKGSGEFLQRASYPILVIYGNVQ